MASVEGASTGTPSPKKEAKRVFFPFGSSVRSSYSEYAHLGGDTKLFAESLCVSTNIIPEIRGDGEDSTKKKEKAKDKPKVQINPELLQDLNIGDSKEQCTRKACQDIVRKILESQSMNKIERDEISEEYERLTVELAEQEAINFSLEAKLEMIVRDGNQLELTLVHLNSSLSNLDKVKLELQSEKDSFNGKKMTLDMERQNWVKKKQEAEAALNDALWKTNSDAIDDKSTSNDSFKSTLTIKKSSVKSIRMASDVSGSFLGVPGTFL